MLRTRWQPLGELRTEMNRLRDEMEHLFGRWGNGANPLFSPQAYPPLNMWEDEDRLYVEAELPGLELSDLEIYVNAGNQLTIKGRRNEPNCEKGVWHRRELGYGSFARTMELPSHVEAANVAAEFRNGVLTITLPKAAEAKPRRIEVKTN